VKREEKRKKKGRGKREEGRENLESFGGSLKRYDLRLR
jgi:hypothetical protein